MRKIILIITALVLSFQAFGQKKNVVKIDLLRTVVGQYNIGYKRAFSDRFFGNFMFLATNDRDGTVELFGFGGQFDYRYYFFKLNAKYSPPSFRHNGNE